MQTAAAEESADKVLLSIIVGFLLICRELWWVIWAAGVWFFVVVFGVFFIGVMLIPGESKNTNKHKIETDTMKYKLYINSINGTIVFKEEKVIENDEDDNLPEQNNNN